MSCTFVSGTAWRVGNSFISDILSMLCEFQISFMTRRGIRVLICNSLRVIGRFVKTGREMERSCTQNPIKLNSKVNDQNIYVVLRIAIFDNILLNSNYNSVCAKKHRFLMNRIDLFSYSMRYLHIYKNINISLTIYEFASAIFLSVASLT